MQLNVQYTFLHCFGRSMLVQFTNTRQAECLESSLRKKDLYILRTLTVLGQLSNSLLLENTKNKIFTKVFLILKTWQFIQLLR